MWSRPERRSVAVGLALVVLGAACSGSSRTSGPATTTPRVQKGGTITVVGQADPITLNPKSTSSVNSTLMASVWRGVWTITPDSQYRLNTDLVLTADVVSTDPQTVVYKINPNATWSDGVPFDADDFLYNWQLNRAGATDIDGARIQTNSDSEADAIADVTGSDGGKTVTVVFRQAYSEWKAGRVFNTLVPAHVARRVGFNSGFDHFDPAIDVSDAAFRLANYSPDRDMTFVRNDRYWGAPANLDSVIVRFTDPSATSAALRNGEGDLANGQDALPDAVAERKRIPGFASDVFPSFAQESLYFNQRNELLAIPDVRRAVALAVDRRAIFQRAFSAGSVVDVVDSFLWTTSQPTYHDTSGGRYDRPDLGAAKGLLDGAGFALAPDGVYSRGGKRLSFRLLTISAAPRDEEAQLVQSQLKAAGIDVGIDARPLAAYSQAVQKGDYDLALTSYVKNLFGTLNVAAGSYLATSLGYTNPKLDQLMQEARGELDDTKRLALIDQADRMLWDDLPMFPLFQRPLLFSVRDTFVNIRPNPAGGGAFWNIEQWARKASG